MNLPVRDPKDLSTALVMLRRLRFPGASQAQVAAIAGMSASSLCEYEMGKTEPSRRNLARVLTALRVPPFLFDSLVVCLGALRQVLDAYETETPADPMPEVRSVAAAAGRGAEELIRAALVFADPGTSPPRPAATDRLEAPSLRAELEPFSFQDRFGLVKVGIRYRSWALADLYCADSLLAAAHEPRNALALTELAVHIAGFVPGSDRWRRQVAGRCETFLGNAWRVLGDLHAANEAFARACAAWPPEVTDDYGLLDASQRLHLESSLRRQALNIPEALSLLERALAICPPSSVPTILVKKAKTLEEVGDYKTAIKTLERALPLIEPTDEHLQFAARFNLAENLYQVGRHAEAKPMMRRIRELAERLGKDLHKVRLRWLEGRIAAKLDRVDDAAAALREVRGEFVKRQIAFDAGLVTVELAVLLADHGRMAEAKALTAETEIAQKLLADLRRSAASPA